MNVSDPDRRSTPLLPLAGVSLVALALEIFATRLLSCTVHALLVYVVLGIALLGFGAAGSIVTLRPGWLAPDRIARSLSAWSLAFAVALLGCYAAFVRIAGRAALGVGWAVAASLVLALPFLCAGAVVVLALSFSSRRSGAGRAYAANLAGSGLGCALPIALLGPLTGPQLLALLGITASVFAGMYVAVGGIGLRSALGAGAVATTVAWIGAFAFAERVFPVSPSPSGQAEKIRQYCDQHGIRVSTVYDRWSPVGRIEVLAYHGVPGGPEPYPFRFYAQDHTAGALVARWDGRDRSALEPNLGDSAVGRLCARTLYGQAYFEKRDRVLAVGVGGGADVQCALFHGARRVDAVEINPATVRMIRGPMNEFLGGIGDDPRVRYHVAEGRSFARAARRGSYDLVVLSGADTKVLSASGALALQENRVHTLEAFRDFLADLTPRGVLFILRFGEPEALRLSVTLAAALRDLGAVRPQDHVAIVQNGVAYGILARRTPFSEEDLAAFRAWTLGGDEPYEGLDIAFFRPLGFLPPTRPVAIYPGEPRAVRFNELFDEVGRGDAGAFVDAYHLNVAPAVDDRPFFFDLTRYDRPGFWRHPHMRMLGALGLAVLGLAGVLILAPVWRLRRSLRAADGASALLFFSALGGGYLMVEIRLLFRFSQLLGHQTYSMGVVLGALLAGTGAGAVLGERWLPSPRRRIACGILAAAALLGVGAVALDHVFSLALGSPFAVRALIAAACVAPVGAALGLAFPAGLACATARSPRATSWCVGINAFASVAATVAAVPIAHVAGYSAVGLAGALLYALALLASTRMRAPASEPPTASPASP